VRCALAPFPEVDLSYLVNPELTNLRSLRVFAPLSSRLEWPKLNERSRMGQQGLTTRWNHPGGIFMKRLAIGNSILLPYLLILAVAVLRLSVSHSYNFIPVFACLLFFGACRPAREFAIPVLILTGVDIFLTTHRYGYPLTGGHAITWIWYLGAMFLGGAMLGKSILNGRVLGSSLLISVSFFVASNLIVWAEWGMYPKTLGGLGACYIAALPFFRNSIVSETVCSLAIFAVVRYSNAFALGRRIQEACS
jgi:Family of unknown function (DUF6580)